MKSLRLLLLALGMGATSFIYGQDLGIVDFYPADFAEIKAATVQNMRITLEVYGTVAQGTKFDIKYRIDKGVEEDALTNLYTDGTPVGKRMASIMMPVVIPQGKDDTIEIKFFIALTGDTSAQNDTITRKYIIREVVANDIKVRIFSPENNSEIEIGKTTSILTQMTNVGTNALQRGETLLEYVTVNDELYGSPRIIEFPGPSISPGDSLFFTFNLEFDESDLGKTYEVCYHLFWSLLTDSALITIEGNHSDNVGCATYHAIANGIDEVVPFRQLLTSANCQNGVLNVKISPSVQSDERFHFTVYDLTGQLLVSNSPTIVGNTSIMMPIHQLSEGIYLLRVEDESGRSQTIKFLK